jgi:hypothetical protein
MDLFHLALIVRIHDDVQVEVAVADVTNERGDQVRRLQIAPRLEHALGQPRDRNADVGDPRAAAGTKRHRCIERVVPCLPQTRAIFGRGRPLESRTAVLGGDLLHSRRMLLGCHLARAVKFEEQRRLQRVGEARKAIHCLDLQLVEQLDPRHGDAQLNGGDDRLDRAFHRVECAHGSRDRFGQPVQADGDFR